MEVPSVKRGKRDGVVDRVVDQGMLRGSHRGLGLAEGRRGLCRAQPVTLCVCARVEKKGGNLGSHFWLQPRQWIPVITLALRKLWPVIPAVARTGNGFRRKSFGAGDRIFGDSFLALAKQPFPTLEKAGISCDNACCVYLTLSAVSTALMTPQRWAVHRVQLVD